MTRGFKIFLLLLHTFVHQQFPFLPVLAFTYHIPVPYLSIYPIYLSSPFALETIGNILVFFSVRCLPDQPSFSLSDSFIQLVPVNTSYHTHTALQSRSSIIQVHRNFYFFCTHPAGFRIQKFCVYTYIHYITHRRAVDSLLIPFPPSFSFLFIFFSSVQRSSPFRVLWIIEIVMSFRFLHQNKTVISAGKP